MRKWALTLAIMWIPCAICAGQNVVTPPPTQPQQQAVQPQEQLRQTQVDSLLAYAATFLHKPYKLGAEGPAYYDCSSFVRAAFRGIGIELPRNTYFQIHEGEPVINPQELKKGDIVLFGKRVGVREVGHVGIVTDVDLEHCDFTFIHCGVTNGVEYQRYSTPYYLMRYLTGRRIISED